MQACASGDTAVLVTVERRRGEVGGLPERDRSPRVTRVHRARGLGWRLAHRHADPLVNGTGLERAAAIARG